MFPASVPGGGHFVLVNKKMQKAAGVRVGGMIELTVEPDLEERDAAVPPELEKLLKKEKALAKWYPKLSESIRREIWQVDRWSEGHRGTSATG